jgi:CBS domain-containing protein
MSTDVIYVHTDDLLSEAAKKMAACGHAALPVVNDQHEPVGMISELDLLKVMLPDYVSELGDLSFLPPELSVGDHTFADIACLPVSQAMRTEIVHTVTEDDPVLEVIRLMVQFHIRRLPVVRDGKMVGIVSRGDLVRVLVTPHLDQCSL